MRLAIPLILFAATSAAAQTPSDIEVSPPEIQLKLGDKVQVAATGYTESGDVIPSVPFRWTSTDTSVVRVVSDPQAPDVETLVAVAAGAAVVEARAGKARGFTVVDVSGGTPRADRPMVEAAATVEAKKRLATCAEMLKLPPIGSWVQWQSPKGTMKLAILNTENRDGKDFYRLEIASHFGEQNAVIQLLSPSWPNTSQGLAEVVTQARGRPPMRIAGPRLASARVQNFSNPVRFAAGRCKQMTDAGTEKITVPAGTFTAHHFRDAEGEYESWIDPTVPFGLVKATSKTGGDIVLTGKGMGAVTALVGTPGEMPARPNRGRPLRH